MATGKKASAVKSAPAVVEPTPAPTAIMEGSQVRFLGYDDSVDEGDQILVADEVYTVVGFTEPEGDDPGGDPIVQVPNPDFNAKKKEHPETNPKMMDVQVFLNEIEVVEGEDDADEEVEVVEEVQPAPVAAPAPAAKKTKTKKAEVAKAVEEVVEEEAPEVEEVVEAPKKAAAKTVKVEKAAPAAKKVAAKTVTKAAAKKVAAKAVAKAAAKTEDDEDTVPELEGEDPNVLAIVEGAEDLIAAAQDLDDQVAHNEYTMGGLVYHIKKNKLHLEITGEDGTPLYAGKGGWDSFLIDHFKMEYRKAQWLQGIYVHFTLAGIENPAEVVARIGWTKAKTIGPLFSAEGTDAGDLIELAETNSAADLSAAIKGSEHVGGTKGTKGEKKQTLRLRLVEAEAKAVEAILETAAEQYGLANIGEALVQIVTEWSAEHAGGVAQEEDAPKQSTAPAKKARTSRTPAEAAA